MNVKELVRKNRSYRRFYQDVEITLTELRELIDLARISSSGMNQQSLKYILTNSPDKNVEIFKHLKWAGYLKDWDGPIEGERPSAYIIMVNDKTIGKNYFWDHGIASTNILLGAVEKGYGGCTVASFNRNALSEELKLTEDYEIVMILALGKPKEEVVLYDIEKDGDIKYWRDDKQIHHVPKRKLEDVILELK